jgi:uncharacterized RDD family membrane protein YckC
MHESIHRRNYLSFWKKFAAALIDGIILNTGFVVILTIITSIVGSVYFPNFDTGTCEIILGLVYFAALDSLPKQVSVGKKVIGIILNNFKANTITFIKLLLNILVRIISIFTFI